MFERFTESARMVIVLAQDDAGSLRHNYIGTEHLLLGLLREEKGLAARALGSLDITAEEVRRQVVRIVGEGTDAATGQIPLTPRVKKVLELALREALALGHDSIGTEHVLLGLVRENQGVASRILLDFGADDERIRNAVQHLLSGSPPGPDHSEKEAAIARMSFEDAAMLHGRELDLGRAVRGGRRVAEQVRRAERFPLVAAIALAAAGLLLGLLVGWLIWA